MKKKEKQAEKPDKKSGNSGKLDKKSNDKKYSAKRFGNCPKT